MAKKAATAAAALLILLLGGSYLAFRPPGDGGPERPVQEGTPPGSGAMPRPRAGPLPESREGERSASAVSAAQPTVPPPGDASPEVRWRLRGRLTGFEPAVGGTPATLTVRVISTVDLPSPPSVLRIESMQAFEADVTALATVKGAVELDLRADHPAYLPSSTRIPLGPASSGSPQGERVLNADLKLIRATPVLGRVLDSSGRAIEAATVAAFPILADGPDERPADRSASAPDGSFTLRLGPADRYLVAAARQGLRPALVEVRGKTAEIAPLILRPGASITGTVTHNGRPFPGAVVSARPIAVQGRTLRLGELEIAGSGDDAFLETGEGQTGEDGTYRVGGLLAGPCRLSCRGPEGSRIHPDVSEWLERTVEAPAKGADLTFETARVVLEVRAGDRPPPKASSGIDGTTPEEESISFGIGTDAGGLAAFEARPGAAYEVTVSSRGFRSVTRRVLAAAAGGETRERFDLEPEPAASRFLRLVLRGEGAESLKQAAVGFFAPGSEGFFPDFTRGPLEMRSGRIEVEAPPPGRWRLVVRPGGPWNGNTATWLDAETEVEVQEEGNLDVELSLRPGGRIRVAARDPEGRFVQARCVLRDATGQKVRVWFTTQHGEGNWSGHSGALGADAPAVVEPALPPGTYRVDLRQDGYLDRVEEVRVEPGRWKDLEVTLERR